MTIKRVTSYSLRKINACRFDYRKFVKLFPHGCDVTVENVLKALDAELNISWYLRHVMDLPSLAELNTTLTDAQWRGLHIGTRMTLVTRRALACKIVKALTK